SGTPFWTTPQAKNTVEGYDGRSKCHRCNTCEICPTGARYSPDFTFRRLLEREAFQLHDRTLIRRLVMADEGTRIVAAEAVREDAPEETIEYRAPRFVLAAGYCWSPALLLASANARFPDGLANRSGNVGRYMSGHLGYQAWIDLDLELYPGMNEQHSLVSRRFLRCATDTPYVRHDLRVWESAEEREPRLRDAKGRLLMGDALLAEWRSRAKRGTARVRGYYDTHPDRESRVVLDPARRNRWGDALPTITHKPDAGTEARAASTRAHFEALFGELARANDGKLLRIAPTGYQDHPCGGCRMGEDPASSVVDSHGRSHDHENLWVVGAPTLPTGGCTNGTLTFVALTLRSAEALAKAG
ncbi:MAG: GMC oxidoreductase, partial [Gammaproteobacteria bacterium]